MKKNYDRFPLRLALFINRSCNLACDYCYLGYTSSPDTRVMSIDTAREIIERAMKSKIPEINLGFFGTEPLLDFPLVKKITHLATQLAAENSKDVTYSLNTNATLATTEMADFFRVNEFFVTVGMDGVGTAHNLHRHAADAADMSGQMMQGLMNLIDTGVSPHIRITYTPENMLMMPDALVALAKSGVTSVGVAGAFEYGTWDNTAFDKLRTAFAELTEAWLVLRARGYDITVAEVESCLRLMANDSKIPRPSCTEARNLFAVDVNGDVYSCYRLVGRKDVEKASIFSVKDFKEASEKLESPLKGRPKQCSECHIAHLCNFCPVSYEAGGPDIYCQAKRISITAIMDTLRRYDANN